MKTRAVSFESVYFAVVDYRLMITEAHKNIILGGGVGDEVRKQMLRNSHSLTSRHKQFSNVEAGRSFKWF